jgi:hypothetical protein
MGLGTKVLVVLARALDTLLPWRGGLVLVCRSALPCGEAAGATRTRTKTTHRRPKGLPVACHALDSLAAHSPMLHALYLHLHFALFYYPSGEAPK